MNAICWSLAPSVPPSLWAVGPPSFSREVRTCCPIVSRRKQSKETNIVCVRSRRTDEAATSHDIVSSEREESGSTERSLSTESNRRVANLRARKSAAMGIEEGKQPLAAYMTLPASQYSVLDATRIERLDEDTFRCYVRGFSFLNFNVEPVLTLSVVVKERGPTVRLLDTSLRGSKVVEEANERFTATMLNIVRWREDEEGNKEIASDTTIEVTLELPGWFLLPATFVERSGSAVMQRILDTAVPRFLEQLQRDYTIWADGKARTLGFEEN